MKSTLFRLRSLIAIMFILALASACSQGNATPSEPSEMPAAEAGESSTSSDVADLQTAQPASTETPQPQSTMVNAASNRHFECAAQAGENATVAVITDTAIDGDLVLVAGDEIAIFTPDGDICAGMAFWTGENIVITAWGDDSQTEEIDGLVNGDPLQFRIWDASEQVEYQVANVEYQEGDGIYVEDGIYIIGALTIEEQ